ncbi:(Fe-S)-binding protein, partial [Pseudomonas aeruginosa]
VKILNAAAVDSCVLVMEERDRCDVWLRVGDETTFEILSRRRIAALCKFRFTRIVSCVPHSFYVLEIDYGVRGCYYLVLLHSTYIVELLRAVTLQRSHSSSSMNVLWCSPW